ncbi:MAG: hypothetical protein AAFV26_00140 [Pseudomonadota bacterium]
MSLPGFVSGLLAAVLIGVAVWLATRLVYGVQWSDLYGWAAGVLATLPVLTIVLLRRLQTMGHRRVWALLVLVPLALAAVLQILFWLAYFADQQTAVLLSMVRAQAAPHASSLTAFAAAAFGLLAALVLIKTMTVKRTEAEFKTGQ